MRKPFSMLAIACVGLALSGIMVARADDDDKDDDKMEPTISVSGRGKVSATPDVADISVGVLTQKPTAKEALTQNNVAMNALMAALKERGVAAKDIQTSQISVNPQYSQPQAVQGSQPPQAVQGNQPQAEFVPRIVGYQVVNQVQITARDLTKLGEILDAVIGAGANQMNGINFRIDEPTRLQDEARKKAMADAKRKAELLAGEGGVVLGPPISIRDGAAPPPPLPRFAGRMMTMAAPADASMPVSAGEQDLEVTVEVIYKLLPPK